MVYSGIYLLPKSNSSTIKSEHSSNSTQPNVNSNHVSNHLKHSKKLSSTGSTSNRSSESSRFNETNSNVTIKSDINKFNKNPKLAPEIIFLIKEHAKTLETINQISKKLQEIELKVDDISQRLSKENSLNSNYHHKQQVINNQNDRITKLSSNSTQHDGQKTNCFKIDSSNQKEKELNQTRNLPYSHPYKDVDHHLSNHLSNNLSANPTNIPNNNILSDDSGGEYGNKTTKTVSDDDELLSILEKITKCSHHILQTQQAYQQQGVAIYNSLSKPYAYSQQNLASNQLNNNQFSPQSGLQQQNANSHHQNRLFNADIYHMQQQPQLSSQQSNLYSAMNNNSYYLLNAKSSPIKNPAQTNQHQQIIVPTLKYANANSTAHGQATSLNVPMNELLFEPNVERFLSNLDQLVSNDETNFSGILGTNQHSSATHLINSRNLPLLQHSQNQPLNQFIPISPHPGMHPSQPIPILSNNTNLRANCLNSNLSPNLLNSTLNSNYGQMMNLHHQSSINQQAYLNNISLHNANSNNIQQLQQQQQQQQMVVPKLKYSSRELLEKNVNERINDQLKQADEWLGMVDQHINRNNKYQQATKSNLNKQHSNNKSNASQGSLLKGDKTFDG